VTKTIVLDPGHSGNDPGAIAIDGLAEKHYTLALGLAVRDELAAYDCKVIMTREDDTAVSLLERAAIANRAGADLLLSLHHDSASNPAARGGSCYIHTDKRTATGGLRWLPADGNHTAPKSHAIARAFIPAVRQELSERYGIPWRAFGDKDGISCADFGVLRYCNGPAILLETHFGSNEHDNWAARRPNFISDLAKRIAVALSEALEFSLRVIVPAEIAASVDGTPILGAPVATVAQAMAWARKRGATERFVQAAHLYWYYGWETGLRSDVLYAQSAKETAFGRHGGVLTAEFNNFAGIKIAAGGGNYDPDAHERFATVADGVRAHFNHMAAYVGLAPIGTPHGRYHIVKALPWAGGIRTVEELGARWAPNPDYGGSIVRDYLEPMNKE
jgi:N-acetylmuramoyl-L-alanine amidase